MQNQCVGLRGIYRQKYNIHYCIITQYESFSPAFQEEVCFHEAFRVAPPCFNSGFNLNVWCNLQPHHQMSLNPAHCSFKNYTYSLSKVTMGSTWWGGRDEWYSVGCSLQPYHQMPLNHTHWHLFSSKCQQKDPLSVLNVEWNLSTETKAGWNVSDNYPTAAIKSFIHLNISKPEKETTFNHVATFETQLAAAAARIKFILNIAYVITCVSLKQ